MAAILEGLRVVELASDRAAHAGKLLGDLGADVIVVEPPGGHRSRWYGPFVDDQVDPDRCLWWWHYNTSKRSVVLDLDREVDRERFRALVATADVVLEAEDPGALDALGIDHVQLRALDPRLVWVSVTPFGRRLADLQEPTTDLTILAAGGAVWNCGYDDHAIAPIRPSGNHAQHTASSFAVLGALTALLHRDVSDRGQHVDVSMLAATNVTTEVSSVYWLHEGATLQRQTGRHASEQPTTEIQLQCADGGYVTTPLALTTAANFQAVIDWLEELGALEEHDEGFFLQMGVDQGGVSMKQLGVDAVATEIYRAGRDALRIIASKLPVAAVFVGAQERGIACGAVYAPDEALHDPHYATRGFPTEVEHPELGRTFTYPGLPFSGEAIPTSIRRAPLIGEHTDEVLGLP